MNAQFELQRSIGLFVKKKNDLHIEDRLTIGNYGSHTVKLKGSQFLPDGCLTLKHDA